LAFKKYISDFGWGSVSELAKKISKSPSYVSKRISLLELPPEVVNLISQSEIDVSTAEELLALKDKQKQHELAVKISTTHLPSKKVRQLVSDSSNHYQTIDEITESEGYLVSYTSNDQQRNLYRSIDKVIITLKIAVKKLVSLIENTDNWLLYEILMQHKNSLVVQIDILIKERKKVNKIFSSRNLSRYCSAVEST
jgi:ParB family chromosome partitioning protein